MRWSPMIAPRRDQTPKAWEGVCETKPWDYAVQLVIPHLDAIDSLLAALQLWNLQTVTPFITIVDTGSQDDALEVLNEIECENIEVVMIRSRGFRHKAQVVAMAQDVALSVCQSDRQLCTHSDVFPLCDDIIERMIDDCDYMEPVVGYEISPRDHLPALKDLWPGMVGHTLTMLHVPTIREYGIMWDITACWDQYGLPADQVDTEIAFNLRLREQGIQPLILGADSNEPRYSTADYDHCRSHVSKALYSPDKFAEASALIGVAILEAHQRAAAWSASRET